MRRFYVLLYAATAVMHLPFVVGLAALLTSASVPFSWGVSSLVGVALWALFHGRMKVLTWDRPMSAARAGLEEAYFVHWFALPLWLLFMLPAASLLLVLPVELSLAGSASAGLWPWYQQLLALSYPPALMLAFWAVVVRRRWVVVRTIELPLAGLPAAFDGYRIAQLSDVHLGSMCPRGRVAQWVARVNGMDVDMVALTGDYVTTGVHFHQDIADTLGALRATDGVYAVMGNHDYFGDGQPLMDLLTERGVRLLRNERTTLRRGETTLSLAGVDDIYTKRCDIPATLAGHGAEEPLLVLAHDPRSFVALAERGADLVLSGHTHWGQVAVPFAAQSLNYARSLGGHHAGLNRHGDAWLYVSPGLGTTGPPIRLGTWPEITVIELRHQADPSVMPEPSIRRGV